MTSRLLSRPSSLPATKAAAGLKAATSPKPASAPKAAVPQNPSTARNLATASQAVSRGYSANSGFSASAPKRLVLDSGAAPVALTPGGASFRVAQGIVPEKAQKLLAPAERADVRSGRAPEGIVPEKAEKLLALGGRLDINVGRVAQGIVSEKAKDTLSLSDRTVGKRIAAGELSGGEDLAGLRLKQLLMGGKVNGLPGTVSFNAVQGIGGQGLPIVVPGAAEVTEAQEAYDEAVEAKAAADQRLAADLAAFGPVMSEAERQAYIEAYWAQEDNAELVDAVNEAGDDLSAALNEYGPHLEEVAASGHPQAQQQAALALQNAYESLATSDTHADEAIAYAERVNNSPELAESLTNVFGEDLEERIGNEVLGEAVPRAQSEIYSQYPNDPVAAAQAFQALLTGFETGKTLRGLAQDLQDLATQVGALAAGDYAAAEELIPEGTSKFAQALQLAGVAQGIFQGIHGEGLDERLEGFLSAAQGGLEQASGILELFGRTDLAKTVGEFASKLAPFIDAAVDINQLRQDIEALTDGANAGEVIAAVGSAVSVLGDVLWFTPVGQVLQILGGVINEVGGLIDDIISGEDAREELREQRLELLEAAGVGPESTRELLVDNVELARLLGTMGLSEEQFLDELTRADRIFDGDDRDAEIAVWQGYQAAALFGLEGQEALDFVALFQDLSPEEQLRLNAAGIAGLVSSTDWSDPDAEEVNVRLQELADTLTSIFGEDAVERFGLDDATVRDVNTDFLKTSQQGR
ncbi:hypothetical protein HPC49_15335 [Pyxidicoccus fallax]|uniref:Uncharacterized protein n=1 Tax=Pyxidicoccus fallax TaxID=394095 RepID=A0A848L4V4_9BACT|nr:hypothetical protein [Pyxidicoccus fallax]NMO13744.1 hypothetical protein [Pyxidicoccus fallax]NPC79592.1 hypothetical protein [Pyxidicoccus fallax]